MSPEAPFPEAHWRGALAEGRLLLQRAPDGSAVFPPRLAAPGTGAPLEWFEASGRGRVYTLSWISRKPPAEPYHVALIDLDEGARLMSRVEGVTPETLAIGMRVEAFVDHDGEAPLLLFRPVED
ncbi:Zn-ribbon domain-containing OB-fold protein [Novosphingobium resinovorum]|uniref:Zn-ribbon domain-containing OB-fold protein n=1 Tax=Novosphingobium resinovorum TaxID=158500 RepID=UPI002ED10BA8|nr:OB-fold domain-containing protein [Novosphingobium resinovorum]